jgi:hypothetical protein
MTAGERRSADRFALDLSIHWTALRRKGPRNAGAGYTVNISGTGVLFSSDTALTVGDLVELTIDWPAGSGHRDSKLITRGVVRRIDRAYAAVEVCQYAFRRKAGRVATAGSK